MQFLFCKPFLKAASLLMMLLWVVAVGLPTSVLSCADNCHDEQVVDAHSHCGIEHQTSDSDSSDSSELPSENSDDHGAFHSCHCQCHSLGFVVSADDVKEPSKYFRTINSVLHNSPLPEGPAYQIFQPPKAVA